MAGRIARWGLAPVLGVVWWWAVLRLALSPHAGALEGAVAAGGWGLSLLPVHCMPKARAAGAVATGRWREAWRGSVMPVAGVSPDLAVTVAGVPTDLGGTDAGVWSAGGSLPGTGQSPGAWPSSATGPSSGAESVPATKASPRRRSDGGSGPS
jgi:hypothetical protein